ncbi:MAG TPA: hypothetical protein ENK96_01020 [Desulfobulbaceae bacterium]|nr:hypothetical protein [Desulfobulbaceae bacterium]
MKKRPAMSSMLVMIFTVVLILSSTPVSAEKVVVVPLFSAKKLGNVVTVAKSGGKFTDPVAAVNSITDASASNPYLVVIGPGQYTLTSALVIRDGVFVAGSGIDATALRGNISSGSVDASSAIVVISGTTCSLSDLSIFNDGGGYYSFALYSNSNSNKSRVNNVKCFAVNGSNNRGVFFDSTTPGYTTILTNVTSYAWASGTAYAYGLYISGAPCEIYNSSFDAFGGNSSRGIYLSNASGTKLINVEASAHDSSISNHGMMCNNSSPTVRQSYFKGLTYGISIISGTVRVLNSSIEGGVNKIGGTLSCVNSNNGAATPLASDCQVVP